MRHANGSSLPQSTAPAPPRESGASEDRALSLSMPPAAFMRRHWQKRPLMVREAVRDASTIVGSRDLFALAARDDVESRLVLRSGRSWSLEHGPFGMKRLRSLPPRNWTLLVQSVNLHVERADALLRRFSFLPYARLDDLMISYAVPGGGVGPHVDAYDVFLLQGTGRRRWRYGACEDSAFRPGLPLRILRHFAPTHEHVLGPGDMLYLPPEFAHDGVALDECMTLSVGFRAPSAQEVVRAFLDHLHDRLAPDGRYADPDLAPTDEPARITASQRMKLGRMLRAIRWNDDEVARFAGTWLTEPKPSVFFDASPPLTRSAFARRACAEGVRLDTRSQLLYDDRCAYLNGETVAPAGSRTLVRRFANARRLTGAEMRTATPRDTALFHRWYGLGYVHLGG